MDQYFNGFKAFFGKINAHHWKGGATIVISALAVLAVIRFGPGLTGTWLIALSTAIPLLAMLLIHKYKPKDVVKSIMILIAIRIVGAGCILHFIPSPYNLLFYQVTVLAFAVISYTLLIAALLARATNHDDYRIGMLNVGQFLIWVFNFTVFCVGALIPLSMWTMTSLDKLLKVLGY